MEGRRDAYLNVKQVPLRLAVGHGLLLRLFFALPWRLQEECPGRGAVFCPVSSSLCHGGFKKKKIRVEAMSAV
jgi:hypothetical protein